jgi:2-amino-4-hydroxy-6-hydroxymethyldihydropteridine diphosphokinase|tara:strand:- start:223 stop:669 length:447 start_codon:yes stop_codon:yes gene_type:complete
MPEVFISLGSNLDSHQNMRLVKTYLDSYFTVTYSSLYETPAEGFDGENFLNMVCKFESEKNPYEIRHILKDIEKDMGRTANQKGMSNRVIDLDLILYGDLILKDSELELPSPDIQDYMFVLEPMAEIAPDLLHPTILRTIQDLLDLKS